MRYGGFCEVIQAWKEIGLMSDAQVDYLQKGSAPITWVSLMGKLLGVEAKDTCVNPWTSVKWRILLTTSAVVDKLRTLESFPEDQAKILIGKFRQLGLFSDEEVSPRGSIMRSLSALLEEKCKFEDGEVDLILLQHTFEIERADGRMVSLLV